MKPTRLEKEAEEELLAAASWYNNKRPGLGPELLDVVEAALAEIAERPQACALVQGASSGLGVRRKPVERFPYWLVFLERDAEITVLAVAHTRRRPLYWLKRI